MSREQQYFIRILSDFVSGRQSEAEEGIDWKTIFGFAKQHELASIVFRQCNAFIPNDVKHLFEEIYYATEYFFWNRMNEIDGLETCFREAAIPFFLIKGLEIAGYYPEPAFRTMGDIDIVVHSKDRPKAHEIMLEQGFEVTAQDHRREWQYYKKGLEYELHDRLVYEEPVNRPELDAFFNDFWQYVSCEKIDVSFHFLYLVFHMRKHFMNEGVGFRPFLDLTFMAEKEQGLDWPWIEEKLNELGLMPFVKVCFGFTERWFGVQMPICGSVPDEGFFETGTEATFANGIFGFHNEENAKNRAVNKTRHSESRKTDMVKNAFRYAFPAYEDLCQNERYRFLKGKPFLLPAAWTVRAFRGLKRKSEAKKGLLNNFVDEETIAKRDAYLKQWGL